VEAYARNTSNTRSLGISHHTKATITSTRATNIGVTVEAPPQEQVAKREPRYENMPTQQAPLLENPKQP
jgi:hypothetical protein